MSVHGYLDRGPKSRANLKKVAMTGQEWWLRTFDMNSNGVVKPWCGVCKKGCRGGTKNHIKFCKGLLRKNFRRWHHLGKERVWNFCAANNDKFDVQNEVEAKNGRPTTLTPADQTRRMDGHSFRNGREDLKVGRSYVEVMLHFCTLSIT